jgi:signal transduction histidine kinase
VRLLRRLWPRSLANRTALVLLAGLAVVQAGGLLIYTLDRLDLQRLAAAQELGLRISTLYRSVVFAPPEDRAAVLKEIEPSGSFTATLDTAPAGSDLPPSPPFVQRIVRISLAFAPIPQGQRWRDVMVRGIPTERHLVVSLRLPTGEWLNVNVTLRRFLPFLSEDFLIPFVLMSLAAALLVIWAVRQFSAPMRDLAAAAEQLGRDVNAPPLPERGSAEGVKAARAFNVMAERIRRFVRDRTFLLTAIGHDLRTPITRLKLRAEWMEDEEQQHKMLADLDELESMVAATLAFGRDDAAAEALAAVDLAELLRTIGEEAADAQPEEGEHVCYAGPQHQVVRVRPVAMKRALTNLVQNALKYGGKAHIELRPARDGAIVLTVDDDGPGIPPAELERVFEPFHRLEASRNRETGGTGLGLPIARNIVRAHGGDIVLSNRSGGGLRATVTLPA